MAEKTLQEKYDELSRHAEGLNASLLTLQTNLDAKIQELVDLKASHEAKIKELNEQHRATNLELQNQLAKDLEAQVKQIEEKYAAALAKFKQETLGPIMRDNHERAQRELAAKHQAELAQLS